MLYIFLDSIYLYGQLDNETDILIYTSTEFMEIIKKSNLYSNHIKFEINDTYNNTDKACKARLDLFKLESANRYEKILYLDTDILVKRPVNILYDLIKEDIIYTLREGVISKNPVEDHNDFWGCQLFEDNIDKYVGRTGFTSGILLFRNCNIIENLFEEIREDIIKRPHNFGCHDQPYFVYHCMINNLFDNEILTKYAINNCITIFTPFVVHHFPGGPGHHKTKIEIMTEHLTLLKEDYIRNVINDAKNYINYNLLPIIKECNEPLEGNVFMTHNTLDYTEVYLNKIKNIILVAKNNNIRDALEIGFNAGFSALLMLLSNPNIIVTCIDNGEHSYMLPCFMKMKSFFGERLHLFKSESIYLDKFITHKYDLIHIDGSIKPDIIERDIINCYNVTKDRCIMIIDDYDINYIYNIWNKYIELYKLKSLDTYIYPSIHHNIKYINKNI